MINYLFSLPEELIHEIYKKYYSRNCIPELISIKCCKMCRNKINSKSKFKAFSGKCICCQELLCCKCWYRYSLNYCRGWQPHLYHCKDCWISKIRSIT